jgi:hypothetical protein
MGGGQEEFGHWQNQRLGRATIIQAGSVLREKTRLSMVARMEEFLN